MSRPPRPTPAVLAAAEEFVHRRTGLSFTAARRPGLEAGLARAMRSAGCRDPADYLSRLAVEDDILDALIAEVTVGETYFFRDPDQLALVGERILPELLSRRPAPRPLRIWSAGCATGEEPYTLAILLDELGARGVAHVIGTDLSRTALARARSGRYGPWSLRAVPAGTASRCFEPDGEGFRLAMHLREAVEFRYLNLVEDVYPSLSSGIWGMDLILCRNVLIYFDGDTVARVVSRLVSSLAPDGWLLLGASDPLIAEVAQVRTVITAAGLAYCRGEGAPGRAGGGVKGREPLPATHADAGSRKPRPPREPRRDSSRPTPGARPPQTRTAPVRPVSAAAAGAAAAFPSADVGARAASKELEDAVRAYAASDYGRAARLVADLVRRSDSGPEPWVVLVRSSANQGDLEAAGRACAAALERHAECAELIYLHGLLLSEAGRHVEAVGALRRALYLDRDLAVVHLALGGELQRLGDGEAARRAFRNAERLLEAVPADAVVPASDGERAGRLAGLARLRLELLEHEAA